MQSMKKPVKMIMITALHDKPCKYPNGDYLNLISILNKQVHMAIFPQERRCLLACKTRLS